MDISDIYVKMSRKAEDYLEKLSKELDLGDVVFWSNDTDIVNQDNYCHIIQDDESVRLFRQDQLQDIVMIIF